MEQILSFDQLPKAVNQLCEKLDIIERLLRANKSQQPNEVTEQLLTVEEAAEFLKLAVPTIYSKVSKRELPVMKRGKRLYFSSTELMAYLKEGQKQSYAQIDAEADKLLNSKL